MRRRQRTLGLYLVGAGVVLAGGYWMLRLTHVGKFGAPTDIGGGLMALAGYGLLLAGVIVLLTAFLGHRSGS